MGKFQLLVPSRDFEQQFYIDLFASESCDLFKSSACNIPNPTADRYPNNVILATSFSTDLILNVYDNINYLPPPQSSPIPAPTTNNIDNNNNNSQSDSPSDSPSTANYIHLFNLFTFIFSI